MKKWDPKAYSRNSERQSDAALSVIDQLEISSDARILDIGCGDGKIAHELARRVPEGLVVGVDASRDDRFCSRRAPGKQSQLSSRERLCS